LKSFFKTIDILILQLTTLFVSRQHANSDYHDYVKSGRSGWPRDELGKQKLLLGNVSVCQKITNCEILLLNSTHQPPPLDAIRIAFYIFCVFKYLLVIFILLNEWKFKGFYSVFAFEK
jgi:hypothetical protein